MINVQVFNMWRSAATWMIHMVVCHFQEMMMKLMIAMLVFLMEMMMKLMIAMLVFLMGPRKMELSKMELIRIMRWMAWSRFTQPNNMKTLRCMKI